LLAEAQSAVSRRHGRGRNAVFSSQVALGAAEPIVEGAAPCPSL